MITKNPYGLGSAATKPGHAPEPPGGFHCQEPLEKIEACLNCPVPGSCHPMSAYCPLNKSKLLSDTAKSVKISERREKIKKYLADGWNSRQIWEELHISDNTYYRDIKALRERGEIE